jgi:protein O-mannosyl-transferase
MPLVKPRDWPFMVLLALATAAVFWPVKGHDFINYDDYAYVTRNGPVTLGLTWEGLGWAFREGLYGESAYWHPLWHPLTWLSHMLDCQLFGLKPAGHHLGNVFFHVLNSVLLFALLRRMTGQRWRSALVAALFALHPLQVNSVAWVAERKNVLSTVFWMLTLLAYVRYTARPGWGRYTLVFALLALGLMAKPTLVTLPCVMLLLDFWPLRRLAGWPRTAAQSAAEHQSAVRQPPWASPNSLGWLLLEKLPLLALSAASCLVTIRGHQAVGALAGTEQLPLFLRGANAVVAYVLYLRNLIWPVDLSVFYMHPGRWPAEIVIGCAVLLLGLSALTLQQLKRRPYLLVGWLWFIGTLVPTIGLVQADVQAMADRFAYVPVIGVFVMIVWAAADACERWPCHTSLSAGLAGVALAGCVAMTSWQLHFWRDSVTLLQRAVEVAQDNSVAHLMLGNALFERGKLDQAMHQYQQAMRLRPDDPNAWQRAGAALSLQGRPAEATQCFQKASQLAPRWPEPRRDLALALVRQGRMQEARAVYDALQPLLPPTPKGHTQLAEMLAEGRQAAAAIKHYREALRLDPRFLPALNNLAWLLSTWPQSEWRNGVEAVKLAERACQLSHRRTPHFLGTLAAAYAETGRFSDAVKTTQEAQALARASGDAQLLGAQSQMLERFRMGKPFHEGAP